MEYQTENERSFMQGEDVETAVVLKEEGKRICSVKRAFKEMLASKRYLQFQTQYKKRMFDSKIERLAYEKKLQLAQEDSLRSKIETQTQVSILQSEIETEKEKLEHFDTTDTQYQDLNNSIKEKEEKVNQMLQNEDSTNPSIEKWQQKLEQLQQLQDQLERDKMAHATNPYVSAELKQNLDELAYINSPESVNAAYQLGKSLHTVEQEISKKEMEYQDFIVGKKHTEEVEKVNQALRNVEKVSQIYQEHEQYKVDTQEVIRNLKIQKEGILKQMDADMKRISQLKLQTSVPYVLASGIKKIVTSTIKGVKKIAHEVPLAFDPTYQYALQLFNKSYMTFLKDDIAFEQFLSLLKAFSKSADDENKKTK